jgi:carbamoyl-phosphate synthase large subunit
MAVKEAVFPFARFPGVDPVLSPEMKSTGEVMGIDGNFAVAFAKAQLGAGTACRWAARCSSRSRIPTSRWSCRACASSPRWASGSWRPAAPRATWKSRAWPWSRSTRSPKAAAHRRSHHRWRDCPYLQHDRRLAKPQGLAIDPRVGAQRQDPYFTTATASVAAAEAIEALRSAELEVQSLQDYYR